MALPSPRPSSSHFLRVQAAPFWVRMHQEFADLIGPGTGQAIDVGCGPGLLCRLLTAKGWSVIGFDRQPDMVEAASRSAGSLHSVAVGDISALPIGSKSAELVTCTNLLFFLPDAQSAVIELARVCKTGGRVAVLNPATGLTRRSALALALEHRLPESEAELLANWGYLAERNGVFDESFMQTLFEVARVSPPTWQLAGIGRSAAIAIGRKL